MFGAVSYGVQQATIWTLNVLSVTAQLLHTLLALCFLNHDRHYHYRWCSILFWSLDSGPCMIKNKIYGMVQSAASVVPAEPAVQPALLLLPSNLTNVYFTQCASTARSQPRQLYYAVGEATYEYFILESQQSTNLKKPFQKVGKSFLTKTKTHHHNPIRKSLFWILVYTFVTCASFFLVHIHIWKKVFPPLPLPAP